jgi:O-antigen/teichoic acid export membrane protein
MNTVQKIAKNTIVLIAATIISRVLGFFYVMYIARYLGAEGFGILSFALAFTGIFGVFTDLGLGPLTVREVARDKSLAKKYLNNISVMKIILVTITFALIAIAINLLDYPEQTIKTVYLISLSVVFNSFTGMFYSIFRAFEKMEYQSLGQILNSILMLVGVLFAISQRFSVIGFASLYFMISVVALVYSFVISICKFVKPKMEVDWNFWGPTIKEALPFGLTGISGMLYTYTDTIMLSLMKGDEVVGWYNAAYKLMLILLFIPGVINMAIFPSMSRFYISSKNSLKLMYEKYFKFMFMIGIPIGIGTTLLADRIILLIFGIGYTQSIIALQVLIWTMVLTFTGAAFVELFESINRQIVITKISGICVIVNILLNLFLIPKFSYVGASVATLITEIILVGSIFIFAYKFGYGIQGKKVVKNISKVIIASVVIGAFLWYFKSLNLFILITLAILFYLIMIYLIKGINYEDVQIFKRIIKPRKVTEK